MASVLRLITGPGGWNDIHPDKQILQPHLGMREVSEINRRLSEGVGPETILAAMRGIGESAWHRDRGEVTLLNAVKSHSAVVKHAAPKARGSPATDRPTSPSPNAPWRTML